MLDQQRERLFQKALFSYRAGRLAEAVSDLRALVSYGSGNPIHWSYCGLLVATVEGNVREGLELCEAPLEQGHRDAQLYLNLARLHYRTGWHSRAVQVLRKGIRIYPKDPVLLREIRSLSPRRPSVFPQLSRTHYLNRWLGKARARISGAAPLPAPALGTIPWSGASLRAVAKSSVAK
jgi:tetratricopeptide (TPR) repeat protein